jgi:hypothetical protein
MTNQRATNALQHSKVRVRLSNEAREARRLADVELHTLNREFENEGAREARRLADAELHVLIRSIEIEGARAVRRLANVA